MKVKVGIEIPILEFGAVIALPIAALGVFLGLRAWSTEIFKEIPATESDKLDTGENTPPKENESE